MLIKVYPYGKLTNYLDSVKEGDFVEMQGGCGVTEYLGAGQFNHDG